MMLFFIRGSARALGVVIMLLTLGALASSAQTVSPPPPAEYKVVIRYRIRSAIQVRVARFREMASYLQSLGFKKDPGPDDEAADPDQTRMTGTIASDRARRLLRDRHIQAILLIPAGYDLPAEGDKPVKVQLDLSGGLPLERQRLLSDQVLGLLRDQGFQAAIGYDNRGHTRILGSIPAGALEALLEDLRWQGSGWLAPRVPVADLPLPLRNAWPVEVVEVLPEPAGVPPVKTLPPVAAPGDGQEYLLKIAPALRALAKQQDAVRMEVILVSEPAANDLSWRRDLSQASPRSLLEGQLAARWTMMSPCRVRAWTVTSAFDASGLSGDATELRTDPRSLLTSR